MGQDDWERHDDDSDPPEGLRSLAVAEATHTLRDTAAASPPVSDDEISTLPPSSNEPSAEPTLPTAGWVQRPRALLGTPGSRSGFTISEAPTLETLQRPTRRDESVLPEPPGRYLMVRGLRRGELGPGGVAFDQQMQREVLVRELPGEKNAASAAFTPDELRFLAEARLTGRLDHPAVMPVHDLGRREDGSLFFTSRIVRGKTFDEAVSGEPLDVRLACLPQLLQVADALGYAHARGVVHRLITPGEVVLGAWGEATLLGWDMARDRSDNEVNVAALRNEIAAITAGQKNAERIAYLSPEHLGEDLTLVDGRSDVYCLGALLYLLLTGRPPYEAESLAGARERVLGQALDSPLVHEPACPPELGRVAVRALTKHPDQRHADAREFAADLRSWLVERIVAGEPLPAQRVRRTGAGIALLLGLVLGWLAYWFLR